MPSFQRAQVANPVAALNKNDGTSVNKGYRVIANVFAEWKFKKHFTWKSVLYGDFEFENGRSYQPLPYSFVNLGENGSVTTTTYDNSARTSVSQSSAEAKRYQQDHTLSFEQTFNKKHSINAIIGLNAR